MDSPVLVGDEEERSDVGSALKSSRGSDVHQTAGVLGFIWWGSVPSGIGEVKVRGTR